MASIVYRCSIVINRLSEKKILLQTELEWNYACQYHIWQNLLRSEVYYVWKEIQVVAPSHGKRNFSQFTLFHFLMVVVAISSFFHYHRPRCMTKFTLSISIMTYVTNEEESNWLSGYYSVLIFYAVFKPVVCVFTFWILPLFSMFLFELKSLLLLWILSLCIRYYFNTQTY